VAAWITLSIQPSDWPDRYNKPGNDQYRWRISNISSRLRERQISRCHEVLRRTFAVGQNQSRGQACNQQGVTTQPCNETKNSANR